MEIKLEDNFISTTKSEHPIYISTGTMSNALTVDEMLPIFFNAGIKNVELASGAKFNSWEYITSYSSKINFMVHNYFPVPKKATVLNTAIDSKETYDFVAKAMSYANDVQSRVYSVHAGYVSRFSPNDLGNVRAQNRMQPITDAAWKSSFNDFVNCAAKLYKMADDHHLSLMFENNGISSLSIKPEDESPRSHLVSATDFYRLHQKIPSISILYDVAHAKISARAFNFSLTNHLKAYAPAIKCFHLSDNDGITDSNDIISMDSWFIPKIKDILNKSKTPIPLVIEVYNIDLETIIGQIRLLKKIMEN